jgi:uncharacterized BrkB/YihY/UPF0761 family membrane protein
MDDLLRGAKEKFILEGQKAFIAINGAGAAALLAFLQAIWGKENARALTVGALIGIVFLALGVALGASTYILRHLALTRNELQWGTLTYNLAYGYVPSAAIMFFVFGLSAVAIGGFCAL